MTELPSGWVEACVDDFVDGPGAITDGPFGSNLKTSHYTEAGPRVVRLQNIGDGTFVDGAAHISTEHFGRLMKHSVRPGDVVVASLGDPCPRACLIPDRLGPGIVKADCLRIRTGTHVDSRFLMYVLNSPQARRQAAALIHGVGRPRIGLKGLRALRLPLPPLDEQQRIVDAIEEQFSRLDAAGLCFDQAEERLRNLRRATLFEATQGDWSVITVAEAAATGRHALAIGPFGSSLKVSDYRASGVPLVFVRNIRARRFSGPDQKYVSHEKAAALAAHVVRPGDVLVTKMGDPPGDVAVYPEGPDAIITADCIKITPRPDIDPEFLALAIASPQAQREIGLVTKGVAQKKVSLGRFKSQVHVVLPSLQVQRRAVLRYSTTVEPVGVLMERLCSVRTRTVALRNTILRDAFAGRLVREQDAVHV
jgi:type I restriction enzyme, S subunit